ncbi:hypothetical protein A0128_12745 [Leptospira tipperaryensis]|uniref:Uncharacterized protein n=1 Tax=Leptospira tipperaryensis TaxID=2564040 RepID=A0A1D7UYJ7_9LEPT|nr:hypothetical protein A0128_12745 [Leptospira tipperaryensis]
MSLKVFSRSSHFEYKNYLSRFPGFRDSKAWFFIRRKNSKRYPGRKVESIESFSNDRILKRDFYLDRILLFGMENRRRLWN